MINYRYSKALFATFPTKIYCISIHNLSKNATLWFIECFSTCKQNYKKKMQLFVFAIAF